MTHAKLPRDRTALTVGDLEVGESGFVSISALFVDAEQSLWLTPSFEVKRYGVMSLDYKLVVGRHANGYVVTIPDSLTVSRGKPDYASIPVAQWQTA